MARTLCLFLLLLTPAIGSAATALGPQPVWLYPTAPARQIMPAPAKGRESLLVAIPAPAGLEGLGELRAAAIRSDGRRLTCQPLLLDASNVWVRVADPQGAKAENGKLCAVYLAVNDKALPAPDAGSSHPESVALTLAPRRGHSDPHSWAVMKALYAKSHPREQKRHLGNSINAEEWRERLKPPADKKRRDRGSLARISSILMPPTAGAYRFAVRSSRPSFLLVDGELVATGGLRGRRDKWALGAPRMLSTKPVKIELLTSNLAKASLAAGWILPGSRPEANPQEIPTQSYGAVAMPATTHTEVQNQPLYANFTYTHKRPYRFRSSPIVFSSVTLAGADFNWLKSPVRYQWEINGKALETRNRRFEQRFDTSATNLVTLSVKDSLGFTNSVSRIVLPAQETPREYAVDAELGNLPPACYPTDIIHPVLLLNGQVEGNMPLQATWHLVGPGLDQHERKELPRLRRQRIDVPLGRHHAADLTRIEWAITHNDTAIISGVVRFERPPFQSSPSRVVGSALFNAAGDQVVLVANQYAERYQQPPITTKQAFGRISCLDDFICPGGDGAHATAPHYPTVLARIIDGADHPEVFFHTLPRATNMLHQAYQPLLKMVQAPRLSQGSDVVVLSLAHRDMRDLASPERYERYAAALTDLLSATLGFRVVWFTPPPFGGTATKTRPYAAAIRRVADARNIPVADLYSAGTIMGQQSLLFEDDAARSLSQQGQTLAAELCARALLGGPSASRASLFKRNQP